QEPDCKPDCQPDYHPDHKPEQKPDHKPEQKPDHKPEQEPDCKPDCQPDYHPDHKPEQKPDHKPEQKPDHKPEQKPDHKPEQEPDCKPDCQPDYQPDHKPEQKPDHKPEQKPDHKPEQKPDHKPEQKPDHKPEKKPRQISPVNTYRLFINNRNLVKNPPGPFFVVKDNKPHEESSAVVTFNLDESYKGRTCKFLFEICANCITGSRQLDIFTVLNPPGQRPHPGPSRDQHKGRLEVLLDGKTNWIQKYNGFPRFPCPTGLFGFEVVGAGELVKAGWTIGKTGPKIEVL
ncbi:hypothetical protein LOZ65_006799, partial [Ophidiomyces ophidiicola]